MNENFFNDETMTELLGEAWRKESKGEGIFFSYRQEGQEGQKDKDILGENFNFREFLSVCEKFGVNILIKDFFQVVLKGIDKKNISRLESLLNKNAELKAAVILHEAIRDSDLLDAIKERAAIRWSEGLSDSLFNAVLCSFKPLNEKSKRDIKGEIIFEPVSNWQDELKDFE